MTKAQLQRPNKNIPLAMPEDIRDQAAIVTALTQDLCGQELTQGRKDTAQARWRMIRDVLMIQRASRGLPFERPQKVVNGNHR